MQSEEASLRPENRSKPVSIPVNQQWYLLFAHQFQFPGIIGYKVVKRKPRATRGVSRNRELGNGGTVHV